MEPAVHIDGLTKRYGATAALSDLHLDIAPGEVLGYLGPNGAGKTTTIRLLLGLIRATAGRGEANLWPSLTGAETLHVLGRVHGTVDEAYRDELVERFDLDGSKRVRAYSKGNRQKVVLIAALMTRADLLLLDEPTSGLDPLMEQVFRRCVEEARGRGQTVFLSSHILSEVEALCDRVAILRAGQLVEVGRLQDMRHLSAVTLDADLDGPPPDLSAVAGVRVLDASGHHLRCEVAGPLQPVLDALLRVGVQRLTSREPSLEELFLSHYGTADRGEQVA
jgi:ABC-2 type transport system ATP-binding protein